MPRVLIETNILLRAIDLGHSQQQQAVDSQIALRLAGEELCIFYQNLIEFRAVATRPVSANGLGMTQQQANSELRSLRSIYVHLSDTPSVFAQWEQLVAVYVSEGKQNHDARIVGAMIVHSKPKILTFNDSDFRRYAEIDVVSPSDILKS